VHGSAPDIAGQGVINPTAMLLTGARLLAYVGYDEQATALEQAIAQVYREGAILPIDQGGSAHTSEFARAVQARLG
jgi:isocitrate/isopropylmalate dehydrogenase